MYPFVIIFIYFLFENIFCDNLFNNLNWTVESLINTTTSTLLRTWGIRFTNVGALRVGVNEVSNKFVFEFRDADLDLVSVDDINQGAWVHVLIMVNGTGTKKAT